MNLHKQIQYVMHIAVVGYLLLLVSGCAMFGKKDNEADQGPKKVYMSEDPRSSLKNAGKKAEISEATKAMTQKKPGSGKDIAVQLNVCRLSMVRGDFVGAKKIIDDVLATDFRNRDAKILYANILYLKGKKDNARSLLERLGGANAPESEVANILSLIAISDQDIPRATQLLASAIKKNPNDLSSRMNLGIIQLHLHMVDSAKKMFQEVIAKKKDHVDALIHLAVINAWQGKLAVAEQLYDQAERVSGKTPVLAFNRSVLKKRQKKYKEALSLLKEYIQSPSVQLAGKEAAFALIKDIRGELVVQESKDTKQADELSAQIEKGVKKSGGGAEDPDFVITNVGIFEAH